MDYSKLNFFTMLCFFQMYGEKVEEAEELRLDLQDVKEMYKVQIEEVLRFKAQQQQQQQQKWTVRLQVEANEAFFLVCEKNWKGASLHPSEPD